MSSERSVRIEYVQNQFPFHANEEYVVIFNASSVKFDLNGWRLMYFDVSTKSVLHTHYFNRLKGGSSFDPGERLCVISGVGNDRFKVTGSEPQFPGAHWDLFTDRPLAILNIPWAGVYLFDGSDNILDAATVERRRGDDANAILAWSEPPPKPAIGFPTS